MAEKDPKPAKSEAKEPTKENSPEEGASSAELSIWERFRPIFIVSAIVFVECVAAFFLAPSGNQVFAEGDLTPDQLLSLQKSGVVQTEEFQKDVPCIEMDMGEYSITHSSQSEGATTYVSFHLYGVVAISNEEGFLPLFEGRENQIRDLVRTIIRETEPSELADPGLGLIKREISEKVNRLLGKQMVRAVVFSDYSFVER